MLPGRYHRCATMDCANKVWRKYGKKEPRFCERCEALKEFLVRIKNRTTPRLDEAQNDQLKREERITHRVLQ